MLNKESKFQRPDKKSKKIRHPHYEYLSRYVSLMVSGEIDCVNLNSIDKNAVEDYMACGIFKNQIIWDREGGKLLKRWI